MGSIAAKIEFIFLKVSMEINCNNKNLTTLPESMASLTELNCSNKQLTALQK